MHLTESCENNTDTNQSASLLVYLMKANLYILRAR